MTLRFSISLTLRMLFALCCAAPSLSNAADDLPATFGSPPKGRFVVSKNPYFSSPERAMRQRVAFDKKNRVVNHFCVVGYEWPDGNLQVWVNWNEEKTNILWGGSEYQDMREAGLTTARRNLKLGRDTVETADDVNGSTYLVTHARWHSIADDCAAHGEKYVIKPFSIRRR